LNNIVIRFHETLYGVSNVGHSV